MSEVAQNDLLGRYQLLIDISRDLASTLDLEDLLKRIVNAAAILCNAGAASILLYDQVKKELYFEAASNMEEPMLRGMSVPVDSSVAGWIVTNRQPLMVSDALQDARHFGKIGSATGVTTTSLLGVPLITKDKVVGVLEAINKRAGKFTEVDQNLLTTLGAQAAVAIENARLFQQSDLISELVHELRTPMASLNTAAHLLVRPNLAEDQRNRIVEIIRDETFRISELASSFLDLARLESGRAQFHPEPFEIDRLIEDCQAFMQSRASEKSVTISAVAAEGLPLLKADRDKIKQVLLNLLSNAIKFNKPDGFIKMTAHVAGDMVQIDVIDSGAGIPPDGLKNLFQKFYRVPGSEKLASGTGLGLSICKRIVEIHGGQIEVESEMGVGTTFRVLLPLEHE